MATILFQHIQTAMLCMILYHVAEESFIKILFLISGSLLSGVILVEAWLKR